MVTFSTKKSTINPRASKCIQNISSLSIQRGIWYISYYIFCFIYPLILSSLELTCSLLDSDFCLSWWNGCCWFFLLGYVTPSLNNFFIQFVLGKLYSWWDKYNCLCGNTFSLIFCTINDCLFSLCIAQGFHNFYDYLINCRLHWIFVSFVASNTQTNFKISLCSSENSFITFG